VWRRVGPLLRVLDSAAPSDPALRELQTQLAQQRLDGMRRLAELLDRNGALRTGLEVGHAADVIWTLCAQSNFDALVGQRGWTHSAYETWLADMLTAALLPR
jgi:hypothetical protein